MVREFTRLANARHVESKPVTSTPCLTAVFSGYLGEKQNHRQPKGITKNITEVNTMINTIESTTVRNIVEAYLNNELGIRSAITAVYNTDASERDVEIARKIICFGIGR